VIVDLMSTQARCSEPETEPRLSGSPPRPRTFPCNSLTACAHRLAACSNVCFNWALLTPSAQVRNLAVPARFDQVIQRRDHVILIHRQFPPTRALPDNISTR